MKVVFVAAEVKDKPIYKWVVRNSDGVFAGVTTTRDAISKIVNVPKEKFMLSLAPVPDYKHDCSKEEARNKIGYNEARPLIVYTGKLGMDVLELTYILKAAKQLPEYNFLFTGGRESAVNKVKAFCKEIGVENAIFTGFFNESTAVRNYQLAADLLVSYYTSNDHMIEFNYPQKINEYMSTGNPIITPDFPATRDVLNDKNVFFVAPDSEVELAKGIKYLIENPNVGAALAAQAKIDIQPLSFDNKTKELLTWIVGLK
jgi:glycosyltransferase involved in cell wall biosynthesis